MACRTRLTLSARRINAAPSSERVRLHMNLRGANGQGGRTPCHDYCSAHANDLFFDTALATARYKSYPCMLRMRKLVTVATLATNTHACTRALLDSRLSIINSRGLALITIALLSLNLFSKKKIPSLASGTSHTSLRVVRASEILHLSADPVLHCCSSYSFCAHV